MVISDKISVSKTRNEDLDKCFNGDYDYSAFDRKGTIKAIQLGVKTITASVAFWAKRSGNVIYMFYTFSDFAKYPATVYNRLVQNVITYIIPFALTSYYPALFILKGENPLFNLGMPVLAAGVLMGAGIAVWHRGIRAYESAGS